MVNHEVINIEDPNGPTDESLRLSLRLTNPFVLNVGREPCDIAWKNLDYKIPVKKLIKNPIKELFAKREITWKEVLRDVSAEVKAGEIVAIIGGSGAGKSSLLNSLSGRLTGCICVNGQKRDERWQRLAAYVEQEDIMYPTMTVKETIEFAAMLKLPSSMKKTEKDMNVQKTIAMLGLTPLADCRIGDNEHRGISGGEKREFRLVSN